MIKVPNLLCCSVLSTVTTTHPERPPGRASSHRPPAGHAASSHHRSQITDHSSQLTRQLSFIACTMTTRLSLLLLILMGTTHLTQSFVLEPLHAAKLPIICSQLNAKKSSKQTKKQAKGKHLSTSGFGGAAATPCPCGSGEKYFILLFKISYRRY